MKRHWQYLKYVLRHKWYVLQECLKLGVPIWIAIFHDWDKFLPDEWFPYANYFYGEDIITVARQEWIKDGCPVTGDLYEREKLIKANREANFNLAWLYHQKRNKHHWQYWMITFDKGNTECLPMPDKYRREMLADWIGAGKAITGRDNCIEWYLDNYDNIKLHHETRLWLDNKLQGINDTLTIAANAELNNCSLREAFWGYDKRFVVEVTDSNNQSSRFSVKV